MATYRMDYLGHSWVCNSSKAGGAQAELLAQPRGEPTVYLRLDTKNGRKYGAMSLEELVPFIATNRHAYEIVPTGRKRKFYLEYDVVEPDTLPTEQEKGGRFEELLSKAVADAERVCGPGHAVLSGSYGMYKGGIKYSVHIVRPDRYFTNHAAALPVSAAAKALGADPSVYSRNQGFKFPNQSKLRDSRVQGIITGSLEQHVLTAAFDEGATELVMEIQAPPPGIVRSRAATRKTGHHSTPLAPWHETIDIPMNWAMTSCPLQTLGLIRHHPVAPHRLPRAVRFLVMGWAHHRGVLLEDFLRWAFQGKEDTPERRVRYSTDWRDWSSRRPPGDRKLLLVIKTLYPDVCFDNHPVRKHLQRHDIQTTRTVKGDNTQLTLAQAFVGDTAPKYLGLRDFGEERGALFDVPMGKGKTTQIRKVLERKERSLIITHRQDLAGNIYANCKDETGLQHYNNHFKSREAKLFMGSTNQLVCQLESIHYLHGALPYDNIMIDESELLFNQAATGKFKTDDDVRNMWQALTYHLRNAKRVRCYDGFMGRKTMEVLRGLGIEDVGVVRMPGARSVNRTMYLTSVPNETDLRDWLIQWATDIGKQVAGGKNVMVFYPFKVEKFSWPSMDQIMKQICKSAGIDQASETLMHFGNMDKKERATILSDLNTHWQKRVVMTNSAVTAGVDFTVTHFHRLYVCASGFQNPREMIQWLSRARHLIENEVHVVKICPWLKPAMVPDRIGDCAVYTELIAAVNTELQNNSRSVLERYALDAGYTIKKERGVFSEEVMRLAEEADLQHDLGMLYDNIEAIGFNHAELIQRRVSAQSATTSEMLKLEKYFFKRRFRPEVDEGDVAAFWDQGFTLASANMKNYLNPECNLRADLPDLCAKLDEVLTRVTAEDAKQVVDETFAGHLDAATVAAIERRYPSHDRECTSDKKFINMVMSEVCGAEVWRGDHKKDRWETNVKKLQQVGDLFAAVIRE